MNYYLILNQKLREANIGVSAAELHGFLSGLYAGGMREQRKWQSLLYQMTNDNQAYPVALMNEVNEIQREISETLPDVDGLSFDLLLPEEQILIVRAEALRDWTSHFMLGVALAAPQITKKRGHMGESFNDLHKICQLTYDEEEDEAELLIALEDLIEYVRTVAVKFYTHFAHALTDIKLPPLKPLTH